MSSDGLATRLRFTHQAAADATHKAELAIERRNDAVLTALESGWTYQAIGEVLGLSRQRINQIAADASKRKLKKEA